jgi:hypothetical protein
MPRSKRLGSHARPSIQELSIFNSFKTFWAAKITLVNQTTIPTSQYGYRRAATNDDNSVVSYGKSIVNFGAMYAATQESVNLQGFALSQYCRALQQQATLTNHAAQQQRGASNNLPRLAHCNGNGGGSGGGGGYQQLAYPLPGPMGQRPDYTPHTVQALQKLELLPHSR